MGLIIGLSVRFLFVNARVWVIARSLQGLSLIFFSRAPTTVAGVCLMYVCVGGRHSITEKRKTKHGREMFGRAGRRRISHRLPSA